MPTPSPAEGVRELARHQMRAAILDTARRHLADSGAAGLSLRAVARDVGMVSSALYRYFESRDALLTALIVDAYDSLGQAVETAEAAVPRGDLAGRWSAIAVTIRSWAKADPHQYALVYGSPVPGYAAPEDTIGPASRVTRVLAGLLVDVSDDADGEPFAVDDVVEHALAPATSFIGHQVPTDLVVRGVMAWTHVFGAVSFELFGHLHNVVADDRADDFFDEQVRRLGELVGVGG